MNATTSEHFAVREEQIQALAEFSSALAEACRDGIAGDGKKREAVRAALSAECTRCGIRVSGDELLAIAESADAPEQNPKIKRMRLGYCAREGCESFTYRLFFHNQPGLSWPAVFVQMEAATHSQTELAAAEALARQAAARKARWQTVKRVGIALAVVALLIVIRQWYIGGRILLIREPEKFRVDPLPPGQTESPS